MDLPVTGQRRLSPRIVQQTVCTQSQESEDSHHVSQRRMIRTVLPLPASPAALLAL